MSDVFAFYPNRRLGILFQTAAVLLLLSAGVWGLWQAGRAAVGPTFLLFLLPALFMVSLVPMLLYRLYALWGGSYILERDGIRLQWGLRIEVIPMNQIVWVRPAGDIDIPLPQPWLRWPGSLVGVRHISEAETIEYLAPGRHNLLLIAIPGRVFAIAPGDINGFLQAFQRLTELGSLTPLQAVSLYPTFLASHLWTDRAARFLLLGGVLLNLVLLGLVSLAIPNLAQVSLKVSSQMEPVEFIPAVRLLLLPVLSGLFFMANLVLGVFFYRRSVSQPQAWHTDYNLSYLLWASGVLSPLLFLGAVIMILQASS